METLLVAEDFDEYFALCFHDNNPAHQQRNRFKLDDISEELCKTHFRFGKEELNQLVHSLGLPDKMTGVNGTTWSALEGLVITLCRFAYPCRYEDLADFFGRSKSELSIIFNTTIDFIYQRHGHRLHNLQQPWMEPERLEQYARAVFNSGAPLQNCVGFIDGTVRSICRPKEDQKQVFNGHKRVHALKFQSIVLPNGLVANMYGPIEGTRHDSGILRESGLLHEIEGWRTRDGERLCLYGDGGYPLRPSLLTPYQGAHVTPEQRAFNKAMSSARVSVEWIFGGIIKQFAFLDFKKNLKLYLQPVGKLYLVGTLLFNCHTCLYGSETSSHFGINPPTLQEYLY